MIAPVVALPVFSARKAVYVPTEMILILKVGPPLERRAVLFVASGWQLCRERFIYRAENGYLVFPDLHWL
jgi:hypothetical protein